MTARIAALLTAALLVATASAFAQRPRQHVNPSRHPNIAAAQRLVAPAFTRITEAPRANEFDPRGHAAKAKDLLDEANRNLKLAAEASNRR